MRNLGSPVCSQIGGFQERIDFRFVEVGETGFWRLLERNRTDFCGRGVASPASSSPVVEMTGFANRKYRPTVSRSIPSSRAIRRRDQPRSSKL
jgi:hypothetical protein